MGLRINDGLKAKAPVPYLGDGFPCDGGNSLIEFGLLHGECSLEKDGAAVAWRRAKENAPESGDHGAYELRSIEC